VVVPRVRLPILDPCPAAALLDEVVARGILHPPGVAVVETPAVKYLLTCLHCGASIIATERVSDPEVAAVETHVRAEHHALLPAHRLDFAEILGHVRVRMA